MNLLSISQLKKTAGEAPAAAAVDVQLQARAERVTKNNKPYLELTLADSTGSFTLKVWSDSPLFKAVGPLEDGTILRLSGEWTQNQYGLNLANPKHHALTAAEREEFLAGDPALRQKQERDWRDIGGFAASLGDPRLHALAARFLAELGPRFRRSAAARKNHHARRGGLVEHVAQMLRAVDALCGVYPELNRDLLVAGVLFHDCGKLWENCYPEDGFGQQPTLSGEMLGHISLGIEVVNKLWREIHDTPAAREWLDLTPPGEHVRLHLLHLIGSHHGQLEFGSPVLPRTPEAFALHYIDNLDAKLEMVKDAYAQAPEIAPGIRDRVFPLPAPLVSPLAVFQTGPEDPARESEPMLPPTVPGELF